METNNDALIALLQRSHAQAMAGDTIPASRVSQLMHEQREALRPYTMDEIHAMIDQSEREIASGLSQDSEDVFRELEEEIAQEELLMAPAV